MRWLSHPVGFACAAAITIVAVLVLPDALTARRWHGGPLAELTPESLGELWWRDPASGAAHIAGSIHGADAIGVGIEIKPRDGGEAVLGVRWRLQGGSDWYLHAQPHNLGRSRVVFRLDGDENWRGEIAEVVIAPLHALAIEIVRLRVEAAGPGAALERLWFEFAGAETYRQSSLNWLDGMRARDVDWSWWLALTWLAYCAWRGVRARGRLAAADWRAIAALAVLLWFVADVRFTANLVVAAFGDLERFPRMLTADSADGVVATGEPLYREAVRQVRELVPAEAKLGFVTADPSLVIRSRYVFYPRPVVHPPRRWIATRPDYVALLGDDQMRYLPDRRVLRWGQFGRLPAEPLTRLGQRGGVFRATAPETPLAARAPAQPSNESQAVEGLAPLLLAVGAQLVSLAVGGALLWTWCGAPGRGNAPQWSAAYPLGAFVTTCVMLAAGIAGVPYRRPQLAAASVVLVIAALLLQRRRPKSAAPRPPLTPGELPRLSTAAVVVLAALIVAKVAFVAVELAHRPVTGWDSFAVWTLRAKVWAARAGLVLDRGDWFFYGGAARPDYPPHASLLQTWTGVWIGGWHDALVNLPWGFYYLSLLACCYCTTAARLGRDWALAASFALAGIPLVVVHAALGGYADLVLATHLLLAVSLLSLPGTRSSFQLGVLFALSLPLIKLEGIPLGAVCLVIAALRGRVGQVPRRWLMVAALGAVAVAIGAAMFNSTLRDFLASSQARPQGASAVADGLIREGNWHFLWALFAVVAVLRMRAIWGTALGWMLANLIAAAAPLAFALLFTEASAFANARSADSRLFLGIAPTALAFVALALGEASRAGPSPVGPEAATSHHVDPWRR